MTKYEWESELKKNIHRLPDEEIKRVLEYYDELFEDKIEQGKSEREIIYGFGNPADVADKIMSDYDGALKEDDYFDVPPVGLKTPPPISERAECMHGERGAAQPTAHDSCAVTIEKEHTNNRNMRLAVFFVIIFFTGFGPIIMWGALWITLGAFVVAGVAAAGFGAFAGFIGVIRIFAGGGLYAFADIGMGVAICGFGILLTVASIKIIIMFAKFNAKCFRWIAGGEK